MFAPAHGILGPIECVDHLALVEVLILRTVDVLRPLVLSVLDAACAKTNGPAVEIVNRHHQPSPEEAVSTPIFPAPQDARPHPKIDGVRPSVSLTR